jgi:beta-galactosidase GanA
VRTDGEHKYVFLMNFGAAPVSVELSDGTYTDLLTGVQVSGSAKLGAYGVMVLTM